MHYQVIKLTIRIRLKSTASMNHNQILRIIQPGYYGISSDCLTTKPGY